MKFKQLIGEQPFSPKKKVILYFYNYFGHKNINDYSSLEEYLTSSETFFHRIEFHYLMDFGDRYDEYEEYFTWKAIFMYVGIVETMVSKEYAELLLHLQEHQLFLSKLQNEIQVNNANILEIKDTLKCFSISLNRDITLDEIFGEISKSVFYFYLNLFVLLLIDYIFENLLTELGIVKSVDKLRDISKFNEGIDEINKNPMLENVKKMYPQMKDLIFKEAKLHFRYITRPLEQYDIFFSKEKVKKIFEKIDRRICQELKIITNDIN